MMISIYHAVAKLGESGQGGVLCTIVSTHGSTPRHEGSKMLVYPNGHFEGTIGGGELEKRVIDEALSALLEGKPRMVDYSMTDPQRGDPGVCGGQLEIFIEPILPRNKLVVIGVGHVGKEVAHLGRWLGFQVIICDDRPEFCSPDVVPDADEFFPGLTKDLPQNIGVTPWTYVVLTTRNVEVDLTILPALLESEARYIGVIGSRRRWATTKGRLLESGIQRAKIELIHSPIGLRLNAETPREIAVSIMAEIIMTQKNGDGLQMSGQIE